MDALVFPPGFTFWDVEGVPVSASPDWTVVMAWDSPKPRLFPAYSLLRNGTRITRVEFDTKISR